MDTYSNSTDLIAIAEECGNIDSPLRLENSLNFLGRMTPREPPDSMETDNLPMVSKGSPNN
jgi:hypothetical protein